MGQDLHIRGALSLPAEELSVSSARAGGPGGQNVNKVESKIVLRFHPASSRVLSDDQKARIQELLSARLTAAGDLVFHASSHRQKGRNLEEARERLAECLRAALAPVRKRRPTKATRGSKERRLGGKRRRSDIKRTRGGRSLDD